MTLLPVMKSLFWETFTTDINPASYEVSIDSNSSNVLLDNEHPQHRLHAFPMPKTYALTFAFYMCVLNGFAIGGLAPPILTTHTTPWSKRPSLIYADFVSKKKGSKIYLLLLQFLVSP